jgi:hypothetical protein
VSAKRSRPAPPGTGSLGPGLVFRHTVGMLRAHFGRVAGAAFVLFVPPASLHFAAELLRDERADAAGTAALFLLAALVTVASFIRLLGEVFFAGFLDLAVGDEYFRGERRSFHDVVHDLPWLPLLLADMVVAVSAVVGLAFLVVPGLVVYTLFGLVGPVVVQERRSVVSALRRTYQISRPRWGLVLSLVVIPLAIEHGIAEILHEAVDGAGLVVVVGVEWFIAATLLGVVGVVDVALATELMARTPAGKI